MPPLVIETEPTLYVRLNVAPAPIGPMPTGAALVLIVVDTEVAPGNAEYTPVDITRKVTIAPGVVSVDNTSIKQALPPDATVPPAICNISPA